MNMRPKMMYDIGDYVKDNHRHIKGVITRIDYDFSKYLVGGHWCNEEDLEYCEYIEEESIKDFNVVLKTLESISKHSEDNCEIVIKNGDIVVRGKRTKMVYIRL